MKFTVTRTTVDVQTVDARDHAHAIEVTYGYMHQQQWRDYNTVYTVQEADNQ